MEDDDDEDDDDLDFDDEEDEEFEGGEDCDDSFYAESDTMSLSKERRRKDTTRDLN
jgi:hypothetical protein